MAFQYSAQTVTKKNGSIVINFVREKTKQKMKMCIKTSTNKKWQLYALGRFTVCLAGLKETLVSGASQAVNYISFALKCRVYILCVALFFQD